MPSWVAKIIPVPISSIEEEKREQAASREELCEATFDSIPIGHKNAIKPNKDIISMFQDYVDKRNTAGDVVISTKDGRYFRPFPFDATDSKMFSSYIESEYNRADAIIEKCAAMQETYSMIEEVVAKQWKEFGGEHYA